MSRRADLERLDDVSVAPPDHYRLRDGTAIVGELQLATNASQQNVSKHLNILLQAGMVSRVKRGTSACYAISDESVFELCEQVCGGLRRQLSELDEILQSGPASARGRRPAHP